MFEYRQVLARMRQGDSDRDIASARLMGRGKLKTVRQVALARGWLDPGRPLPDDAELAAIFGRNPQLPRSCVSTIEPFRDLVRGWFDADVQGTTIFNALKRNHGYTGSYSAVRRFLTHLKAERGARATTILEFAPADAAQVDFGAGPALTHESGVLLKTWFFVMTLCWSRHQYAELVLDQTVETWLACHRRAFEWFGGRVERVIIDNAKCAITKACMYDPEVQRSYAALAEGYGFRIDACPPHDPAKKGVVEAGVKYVKRSFMPLREFRDLADANRQLRDWVMQQAGTREHGTTREQPLARFAIERPLLAKLPDVPPVLAVWCEVKVHSDGHVVYKKALYSVPFTLVGKQLWLKSTDTGWFVGAFRIHPAHRTFAVVSEIFTQLAGVVARRRIRALRSHVYKANRLSMAFHRRLGFHVTLENDKAVEFYAGLDDLRNAYVMQRFSVLSSEERRIS